MPSHLSIAHVVYVLIQMREFSVASDEKKMLYCATAYGGVEAECFLSLIAEVGAQALLKQDINDLTCRCTLSVFTFQ